MTRTRGRPFHIRLLGCSSAASLLLAAGCAHMTNPLSADSRINRYFEKHPDRPPAIQAAVRNHTVCKGMTADEVRLSWGAPDSIEPIMVKGVKKEEVWSYVEHHKGGTSSEHGSGLFDYDVPLKRAILVTAGLGLCLSEWTLYGEEDDGKQGESRQAADSATNAAAIAATAEASAPRMPAVTPTVDLTRWPALKVTGILKSGQSQVALVNNRLVSPGETVEGATVLAVSPTGVYLQLGTETICLTKGAETHPAAPARRGIFN